MDVRYRHWDPAEAGMAELLRRLERLFHELLLRTDGDVGEALRWLAHLGQREGWFTDRFGFRDFKRWLERRGAVAPAQGGKLRLGPAGERGLRTTAFETLFAGLKADLRGEHRTPRPGASLERLPESRPWVFGDRLDHLDALGTVTNAVRRGGLDTPSLDESDLQVFETEHRSSCASVLCLDVSHSMVLYGEDRITPAKRVALALTELITTRYPKDRLHVVLFGDTAWEVPRSQLPYVGAGPFHTNTRAALELAQDLLRRSRQANRQILLVTDGKPSALTERGGTVYKNPFGLDRRIVAKTLESAADCRRRGIPITTFMLTDDSALVGFVERLTRVNRGRAFYANADRLGEFLLVDYVRNRRRRLR